MDFFSLQCFIAVAEVMNFSEAAEQIYTTQSTLSKKIQKLESELDITLFKRNARGVSLTEAGTALLPLARQALSCYEDICTSMKDFRNRSKVRLGCVEHITRLGLTSHIANFLQHNGLVDLEMKQGGTPKIMELLEHKEIDMAIIAHSFYPFCNESNISGYDLSDYRIECLFQDEYCVVVHKDHPFAQRDKVTWEELQDEQLLLLNQNYSLNAMVKRLFAHYRIPLPPLFEANEVDTLLGLVQENYGVTILSRMILQTRQTEAIAVRVENPIRRHTTLLYRKKGISPACQQFADYLLECYPTFIHASESPSEPENP